MSRNIKSISLLAWLWFGIILIVMLASTVKDLGSGEFEWGPIPVLSNFVLWLASLSFPFVGALIVSHQPQNTIGWLLILPCLAIPLDLFTRSPIIGVTVPSAIPSIFFLLAAYLSNVLWLFFVSPVFFIALLFPTGRPLSPRWHWAALFNPLHQRIQEFIDRRFYRQKHDVEQALAGFATAARNETDLVQLSKRLTGTVQEALQLKQTGLWLRANYNRKGGIP